MNLSVRVDVKPCNGLKLCNLKGNSSTHYVDLIIVKGEKRPPQKAQISTLYGRFKGRNFAILTVETSTKQKIGWKKDHHKVVISQHFDL